MSIWDSRGLLVYCCVVALMLGAAFGSFLNCAAWRIAHGESFLRGRSRCPQCGHALAARDLVPIFSWLFLRGRCRYCKAPVPARYVLAELAFALLTLLCLLRFDLTILCLRNWIFLCCLFCLSLVDLETFTIPDGCLLLAAGAWLLALPFLWPGWRAVLLSLLSALAFGGGLLLLSLLLDRILGRDSLGGGDIKLFAVLGLYLGPVGTLLALILACVLGLVFAFARKGGRTQPIPFGPSISLSAAIVLLYGDGVISWYLSLLGL